MYQGKHQYQPSFQEDFVHRAYYRDRRTYVYAPRAAKIARIRHLFLLLCIVVLLVSTARLIQYARDARSVIHTSDELRTIYYAESSTASAPSPTPLPAKRPDTITTQAPIARPAPTATPIPVLKAIPYPRNSQGANSKRFVKLQRQNNDIIGWLNIPNIIDEAVVHRDNSYYLDRDCLGYPNVNGAIFLDAATDLTTRPYTLSLYGHNMKSGLMFGSLRNYETLSYYQRNAFISFDTVYEEGRYVIFGISTISITAADDNNVDLVDLASTDSIRRATALQALMNQNHYSSPIDIRLDDQLLLLITCVDADDERRVVYARRLRDGETEDALQLLVNQTSYFSH